MRGTNDGGLKGTMEAEAQPQPLTSVVMMDVRRIRSSSQLDDTQANRHISHSAKRISATNQNTEQNLVNRRITQSMARQGFAWL